MPRGGRRPGAGRKPLSIEQHLARNTYRADRHAHRLPAALQAEPGPSLAGEWSAVLAGLGEGGRALVAAHLTGMDDWSPRDLALLRQASEARDVQVALQAVIDAEGVVVAGKPHPALRAERQAGAAVVTALRCLDIHQAPALPASRRA